MFNEKYKGEKCYWGEEPDKILKLVLKHKKTGEVLDLGVGEGRNALFLAQNGFKVTGVDISKVAIKKFKMLAISKNLKVIGLNEDIRNFEFSKKYDIIISTATLHFFKKREIKKLINNIKKNTRENGLNVISVFTEENPNKNFPYLFKKGELKSHYEDWNVLKYGEFITSLEKHGKEGKWHRHGVALIVALN